MNKLFVVSDICAFIRIFCIRTKLKFWNFRLWGWWQLAKDNGTSTKSFNEYIKKNDTTQPEKVISVIESEDVFSL